MLGLFFKLSSFVPVAADCIYFASDESKPFCECMPGLVSSVETNNMPACDIAEGA